MRVNYAISRKRWGAAAVVLTMTASMLSQTTPSRTAFSQSTPHPSRITQEIDSTREVTLRGNVRADLTADRDLGAVEDASQLRLYLVLQRSPEQQVALDNLLARQQQPTAPEYHKWLTPQLYGERFGASQADIAMISAWLEGQGMHVHGVMNNAMLIDFSATAAQIRDVFHTQLHYYNIQGGKYAANAQDPVIPAALAPVVAGIKGLSKIPRQSQHTKIRRTSYDQETHSWHRLDSADEALASPAYNRGAGEYDVTPQDYYTIYNVDKVLNGGNLGASATVAVIEESDFEFGTVDSKTGVASGGDVATFRKLFGVPGTLNMHVYHGYGSVTCTGPGIDPHAGGEDVEASLDAEWANALAPSANLIFMSCDSGVEQGVDSSMTALIDNNLADTMSMSYGASEIGFTLSDYSFQDTLYEQAAAQGQSFFVSAGDSGSDVNDLGTSGTATSGYNVNALGSSPNVTVTGGTDFSDAYDSVTGGHPQTTYWGGTNSAYYGDALSYVPETAWNDSCAGSLLVEHNGYTGAGFCATAPVDYLDGAVVGGSGGFSTHYSVPSYQSGITGYSGTMRALPDISGFAANGVWGHALIVCDSYEDAAPCTSPNNFGEAGGTSFVAPAMAGVAALLRNHIGGRQGLLNPGLYALAKAQFAAAATETACYSNGQASNTGVTAVLPAAACIFNDVTTGNNDVPCAAGSTNCYVDSGAAYGILSLNNATSLKVSYPSTPGYDEVTGIGTVNVYNLITSWHGTATFFTSTTALAAAPTTISATQSTALSANVTGGVPSGYIGTPPALSGLVSFAAGSTALGSCALNSGQCTLSVNGSALQSGSNSITATFSGNSSYPASTSNIVMVTVTGSTTGGGGYTLTSSANSVPTIFGAANVTLNLTSTGYAGAVTFATTVTLNGVVTSELKASAPSVTLTSKGKGSTTLTITASASAEKHAPAHPWKRGGALILAVLLSAPFTLRRKRAAAVLLIALTISVVGFLMSCGGGSHNSSSGSTPASPAASRTYYVTVTATGSSVNATNPSPVKIVVTVP